MSTHPKASVIIVNYNSTEHLNRLIRSLSVIQKIIKEIIVVDNNSFELKKLKQQKQIKLIKNKNNLGFAKAVNQGIKQSKSKFIILLNPDTLLENDSIIESFSYLIKNPDVGVIGGRIKKMYKNSYQYTATNKPSFLTALFEFTNLKKIFPNNKISKKFWVETNNNLKEPTEVSSLCGAYIIFRKRNHKTFNYFDENYFLYLEDLDFCLTLKNKGYKIIFDPRSSINHISGASSNSKYHIVLKYWYISRKYFFRKYFPKPVGYFLNFIFYIEELFLQIYHYIKHEPWE
ncbi:MAG: glycosyltransferase family 2 protein [Candidatus Shapirobacteria bacterium]|nr:glycosyltransferase family 2 protein [Candidatus Shapirobacteria bacterium]